MWVSKPIQESSGGNTLHIPQVSLLVPLPGYSGCTTCAVTIGAITASTVQVQARSSLKLVIHITNIAYIASIHDILDLSYIYDIYMYIITVKVSEL